MSIEDRQLSPPEIAQPFEVLSRLIDASELTSAAGFTADVGMPYEGDPLSLEGYIIIGGDEVNKDLSIPRVRGSLRFANLGNRALGFSLSRFYVPGGGDREPLDAVGMPRFRNEKDDEDHLLKGAPLRVRNFGTWLDLDKQIVGVTARGEDEAPYRAEFDIRDCHFPDYTPAGDADVAYRIGVATAVTAINKYAA